MTARRNEAGGWCERQRSENDEDGVFALPVAVVYGFIRLLSGAVVRAAPPRWVRWGILSRALELDDSPLPLPLLHDCCYSPVGAISTIRRKGGPEKGRLSERSDKAPGTSDRRTVAQNDHGRTRTSPCGPGDAHDVTRD